MLARRHKISHADKNVVTRFINKLKIIYGKQGELTISRGKRHEYLGMILDFSNDKVVMVDMREYVKATYKMFPEGLGGHVNTPASKNLMGINTDAD